MKWILPIILILLLATTALAVEENYLIVLSEDDGVEGVMTAMEFAANMQADPGVTFTAKPDHEVFGKLNLDGKMVVYLRGENAQIMASSEHILESAKAKRYLLDMGFEVEEVVETDFEEVDEPVTTTTVTDDEEEEEVDIIPECTGCLIGGDCIADGTRLINDGQYCLDGSLHPFKEDKELCDASLECRSGYCDTGVCNDVETEPPAPKPAQEEPRTIFGKIIRWFAKLFR